MNIVLIILEVLLLFNLLIFVHELGHYLAARWRGLKIDRFAIWFGKPIWKKRINGVEYAMGWIPAGGYVSLPQMAPMEMIEGKSETPVDQLPPISALDKIIVAFAGPFFSFALAVVFAVIIAKIGRPVSESETTRTIGFIASGTPAEKVGLRPGDKILEVDHKPVSKFGGLGDSVRWRIVRSEGDTIPLKIERDGAILTVDCKFFKGDEENKPVKWWQRKPLRKVGLSPAYSALIKEVIPGSPADRAGLRDGDQAITLNGQTLYAPEAVLDFVDKNGGKEFTLGIKHGDEVREVSITPVKPIGNTNYADGIAWAAGGKVSLDTPGVVQQVQGSVDAMISTFGALFSPKSDIKAQHLSGPLKITNIFYQLFQDAHGWRMAIWFSVILNVNLALLNLLPIPVLDGGHIMLAMIEAVRRRPISIRLLSFVQTGCAALIIGYMLYILFYDVQDSTWRRHREPEMKFAPAPSTPGQPPPK